MIQNAWGFKLGEGGNSRLSRMFSHDNHKLEKTVIIPPPSGGEK